MSLLHKKLKSTLLFQTLLKIYKEQPPWASIIVNNVILKFQCFLE